MGREGGRRMGFGDGGKLTVLVICSLIQLFLVCFLPGSWAFLH